MTYEDIVWHDGQLTGMSLEIGKRAVLVLKVSLPTELLSTVRNEYVVRVESPSRLFANFDIASLLDNHRAGNISDGKVIAGKQPRIILTLVEGYFEAMGTSVEIGPG